MKRRIQDHLASIEEALLSDLSNELLGKLRETSGYRFETWDQLLSFMRTGTDHPGKDQILRGICKEYQTDGDPIWQNAVLVIMWPGLRSLCRQRRRWDSDPEDLLQEAILAILESFRGLDIRRRQDRIAQKLYGDTCSKLKRKYQKAWKRSETPLEDWELERAAGPREDLEMAMAEQRIDRDFAIKRLERLVKEGHLSKEDKDLLVRTRWYGESLADYARRHDLTYEGVKKRRQRVERRIQDLDKKGRPQ